jgi:hypothetical protein
VPEPLEPVTRPNGKVYHPRRIVAYEVAGDGDYDDGVLVLGTHDIPRAQVLADRVAKRLAGSTFTAACPEAGWWRDGFEGGERRWVWDGVRGRAGVMFSALVETAPAGLEVTGA